MTFNSASDASAIAPLVNQYLQASIGATMQGGWLNAAASGTGFYRGQSMPIPTTLYNFAQTQPVTIGGTVYLDSNRNGTLDTGEPGISGVAMTLSGTNGLGQSVTATTTTTSSGSYSFSTDSSGNSLLPGTYQVAETEPSGYTSGSNTIGTVNGTTDGTLVPTDKIGSIVLTSGQSGINYNFGEVKPVIISGTVYKDITGNGVLDSGDVGIAGVTLNLSATIGGQSVTATTTTSSSGTYTFTTANNGNLLAAGTYQITETVPSGYRQGINAVGTVNGTKDGTLISPASIGSIVMALGQSGINYNFGDVRPITIGGTVYLDANENGQLSSGDTGISGVTLTLSGTSEGVAVTATTNTAANGTYSFSTDSNGNLLLPGTYQITETTPSGDVAVSANVGTVNGTTDGIMTSASVLSSIALNSNQNGINYNFGLNLSAGGSGYVYLDFNRNQVMDALDAGFAGATLTLTGTNVLGQSVSVTTTTASNGYYTFAGLLNGTYNIVLTPPGGIYSSDAANVGTVNGVSVGTANTTTNQEIDGVQLLASNTGINYDFGIVRPFE